MTCKNITDPLHTQFFPVHLWAVSNSFKSRAVSNSVHLFQYMDLKGNILLNLLQCSKNYAKSNSVQSLPILKTVTA
jgi:hypothetical protein